jgi:myo-inositol-1(or 4)-monophosphatase
MPDPSFPADALPFALRLAEAARAQTLPRFASGGCLPEDKSGGAAYDPVTEADREGELAIRRLIEAEHPDHGISGEEFGLREGRGEWSWSLDPVDGTRAFVFGLPTWTTLIALLEDGRPVTGIIDTPVLGELYLGTPSGAWLIRDGGQRAALAASGCARLAEARLTTTDPALFDEAGLEAFVRIREQCRLVRYGLDAYGYARLAAGTIDLVVEAGLKPHDYNALIPVVREAGGMISDWRGGQDYEGGQVVAAASEALLEAALERLAYA